ncbi:MAG: hypothetical protein WBA74_16740 [Cyclobacteriaceae bacterium]
MRNILLLSLIALLLTLISLPVMAQGAPPATPIDGGLSLLLAAGGVYGVKKIRDYRKANK